MRATSDRMPAADNLVLDACALLRLLQDGPGAERIQVVLQQARKARARVLLHIINLGEVIHTQVTLRDATDVAPPSDYVAGLTRSDRSCVTTDGFTLYRHEAALFLGETVNLGGCQIDARKIPPNLDGRMMMDRKRLACQGGTSARGLSGLRVADLSARADMSAASSHLVPAHAPSIFLNSVLSRLMCFKMRRRLGTAIAVVRTW